MDHSGAANNGTEGAADHSDYTLLQSRANLMAVSQMSDLRANLMITLGAVMLQFGFSHLTDPVRAGSRLHFWIVIVGSLLTILLSAYSTLPKATFHVKRWSDGMPLPKTFQLLFFGSYIHISHGRFRALMREMLASRERTHDAIVDELYYHGHYIAHHKFLPLRWAYIIFIGTWCASAVAYMFTM